MAVIRYNYKGIHAFNSKIERINDAFKRAEEVYVRDRVELTNDIICPLHIRYGDYVAVINNFGNETTGMISSAMVKANGYVLLSLTQPNGSIVEVTINECVDIKKLS